MLIFVLNFRFHKLLWGSHGSDGKGIVVAGSDNGNIFLWRPSSILKQEEALIGKFDKHKGSVSALDFNSFQVIFCLS